MHTRRESNKISGIRSLGDRNKALTTKSRGNTKFQEAVNNKQLRQFLEMINFYRRFIPGAAKDQATLNDITKGSKMKGRKEIQWSEEQEIAFEHCKDSLSRATELAHPDSATELLLTTDASDTTIGAVIEQRKKERYTAISIPK